MVQAALPGATVLGIGQQCLQAGAWRQAQPPIFRQRQGQCFLSMVNSSAASDAAMHTQLSALQEQAAHSTSITECSAWHAGITLHAPLQQRCASPHLRPLHSGGGYHAVWAEDILPCIQPGEVIALDTHALAWAAAAALQAVHRMSCSRLTTAWADRPASAPSSAVVVILAVLIAEAVLVLGAGAGPAAGLLNLGPAVQAGGRGGAAGAIPAAARGCMEGQSCGE